MGARDIYGGSIARIVNRATKRAKPDLNEPSWGLSFLGPKKSAQTRLVRSLVHKENNTSMQNDCRGDPAGLQSFIVTPQPDLDVPPDLGDGKRGTPLLSRARLYSTRTGSSACALSPHLAWCLLAKSSAAREQKANPNPPRNQTLTLIPNSICAARLSTDRYSKNDPALPKK